MIVPSLADEEPEPSPAEDDDEAKRPSPVEVGRRRAAGAPRRLRTAWPAPRPGWPTCSPGSSTRPATDELHGEAAARLIPTDAPPGDDDQVAPDADELPLAERYALVVRELERSLARHVKRELSDEQNEMLDAVRRDPEAPAEQLLADPEDHVERYVNAASATLSDAALAASELLPAGGTPGSRRPAGRRARS